MKPTTNSSGRLALLAVAAATCLLADSATAQAQVGPVRGEEAAKGGNVPDPTLNPPTKVVEPKAEESAKETPPAAAMDPQMQVVLDKLDSLNGLPLPGLSPEDARKQPTPADAVKRVMKDQGKDGPEKVGKVDDIDIKLSTGEVKGRVYKPDGDGPFPVILYIHGGGWVIADLDTYDATPRALSNAVNAVVISTHYRQAPEHHFPAAHQDVFGAYQWTLENAGKWGGNGREVAVVGESAGGNMAVALSMMAQAQGLQMPVHQVLVYPVASTSMDTESYRQHADAKPLNAAMMKWFFDHTLSKDEDRTNHEIDLLGAKTLKGLPPTTIITADIDPLRSEGEALAKKLQQDGVPVSYRNYEGVTHEFFGMGAVVDKARQAMAFAAGNLKQAFDDGTAAVHPAAE